MLSSFFETSGELFIHQDSEFRKYDFEWPLGYPDSLLNNPIRLIRANKSNLGEFTRAFIKYKRTNYWDHTLRPHKDFHKTRESKLIDKVTFFHDSQGKAKMFHLNTYVLFTTFFNTTTKYNKQIGHVDKLGFNNLIMNKY